MTDILTITLNPSLDLSAETGAVIAGPKLRLSEPVAEPGGGGINAARAAAALGGQARAVAALGGLTGGRIQQLLDRTGVILSVFSLPGETRQSLSVTDQSSGEQYRFVMPGPLWTAAQVVELLARLADDVRRMGAGAVVVLSGSQPPGIRASFPTDLVRGLPGARVIVDTSGAALDLLVRQPEAGATPHVLRMDHVESESLAGQPLRGVADSLDFAQDLVVRGVAEVVILARGAEGSVLATRDLRLHCAPPRVAVQSKIGAGDSFTGVFALALAQGQGLPEALRRGTAAAAAAVMTPGSELCRGEDALRLVAACHVFDAV
jgi:6-phosphofructokinase 2